MGREYINTNGTLMIHTVMHCRTQNSRNLKNLSRVSSKRASLPSFNTRANRYNAKRKPHVSTKMSTRMARADPVLCEMANAMTASAAKFVP